MTDDLVQRVARLYEDKWGVTDHGLARAAIALALEEAARVVDSMAEDLAREFEPSPSIAWVREKAAAISALIPQEPA